MTSPAAAAPSRRRIVLGALALLTAGSGLLVHATVDGPFGDAAGDALYAVLVYLLAAWLLPHSRMLRPAVVAVAICAGIELFQLTGFPRAWASVFPPSALLLGSGFDVRDIVVYTVAISAAAIIDAALARASARLSPGNAAGRPPEGERPA